MMLIAVLLAALTAAPLQVHKPLGQRVFPDRVARAGAAPRLYRLRICPWRAVNPGEKLKHQAAHGRR